jgi:hypothetical protein
MLDTNTPPLYPPSPERHIILVKEVSTEFFQICELDQSFTFPSENAAEVDT